ncbi:hypothetical protein C8R44DRAFT_782016 [Mycena epipterygia]|nr:hypothetical protein C8R44DRAFT_782016 [Mycena epipterygia]
MYSTTRWERRTFSARRPHLATALVIIRSHWIDLSSIALLLFTRTCSYSDGLRVPLSVSRATSTSMHIAIPPLFGVLLATGIPPVYGKGGGKSSSGSSKGSSSSSSSGSSSGKSSGGSSVTIISTGQTVCYNENNQIIRCPPNSARTNLIIGAVVGGLLGCLVLAFLIYWVIMRSKDKRRQREKKKISLPSLSFAKQEYKPLHDQSDGPV